MKIIAKILIAIFIILYADYDMQRMIVRYGNNFDTWTIGSSVALCIDAWLFLYGWYKLLTTDNKLILN